MRIYEAIHPDGKRRYYKGAQEATKAVGGKRAPNTEVAAIDTAALPAKALLLEALNGGDWKDARTILHSKGLPIAQEAPQSPVAPRPERQDDPSAALAPADVQKAGSRAQWAVFTALTTLRRIKPGDSATAAQIAVVELALECCAGSSGVVAMTVERRDLLADALDAFLTETTFNSE